MSETVDRETMLRNYPKFKPTDFKSTTFLEEGGHGMLYIAQPQSQTIQNHGRVVVVSMQSELVAFNKSFGKNFLNSESAA